MIVLFLVDFEADLIVASGYVNLLVNLFTSLENVLIELVRSRFKVGEELDHELLVVVVGPGVRHSLAVLFLVECKLGFEKVEEIFEQEVDIDVSAHVFGQFTHEALVRLA